MAGPRFSVVIPTRDRPATLRFALRTCLEQDFGDYEIIVCDNDGSPAVRQVVDECAAARVRYVRSPRLLSMSANWELAVAETRGEYVLVLGDDDGLLPHALRELDRLIACDRPRALRWTAAYYSWPTIDLPGQANYLRVPLGRELRIVEAKPALAAVSRFEACYTTLPMLYNAAVHRDLIAELRARTGRVFASIYPDVYSGMAFAYLAGTFLSLDTPMTVAGQSGGSFGVATLFHRGKSPRDHEYRSLNAREGLPTHSRVPDLPIFPPVPVADSFLLAKAALFPADDSLDIDRRAFAAHCVTYLRADGEEDWRAGLALIRASLADEPEAQTWFDTTLATRPFTLPRPVQLRSPHLGFDGDALHLSTDEFGVEDVYGAVQLCEKILAYRDEKIRYGLPCQTALQAANAAARAEAARLQTELDRGREEAARLLGEARAEAARLQTELDRGGEETARLVGEARAEAARLRAELDTARTEHTRLGHLSRPHSQRIWPRLANGARRLFK